MNTVIGLPSTGLACHGHRWHLKLGSGFRWSGLPLHLLWKQLEHPSKKMESCGHTAPQYLSDIWSTLSPSPIIRNLVLPILNRSPFPYTLSLQSYSDSVMMNRPFASRFSYGHPVLNSCERTCWTVMECRGLKQKLWWTPTFSLNSSRKLQLTYTLHLAFSYMLCMCRTSHSSTPSLRRAHQMARLGTRSNVLPRSTLAMWCLAKAPSLLGTYM